MTTPVPDELLARARVRIRHDHAYPMGELESVASHHCAGCDVERELDALTAMIGVCESCGTTSRDIRWHSCPGRDDKRDQLKAKGGY